MTDVTGVAGLTEVEQRGHVLVIRMIRTAKRNAVDRTLADALDQALNELDDNPDLWAGVLAGSEGFFSAGSDLKSLGDYSTERGGEYGIIRRRRRKPLIAAVDGPALGGGLEIALACDSVVASTAARFGLPEVTIGVLPTCAGLFRGPRSFPVNLAKELVLTGEPISAERAHAAGFVNALTEPGEAERAAIAMAERICRNAPLSVQACVIAMNDILGNDDAFGWSATEAALESLNGTADASEGITAFSERRPPAWTGR
jgi:enoyl-CoA hydratase/carnithine racemase